MKIIYTIPIRTVSDLIEWRYEQPAGDYRVDVKIESNQLAATPEGSQP